MIRSILRQHITAVVTLSILLVLSTTFSSKLQQFLRQMSPSAPPQSTALQVFLTTPTLAYPDKPHQRPQSPLLQAILADIDAARTSIDLASFDFDIDTITDALIRAHRRGATVRVIVDSENLDTPEVSEQTGRLQAVGMTVRFDRREPFMHDKTIVIDSTITWVGSWNITTNDTYRNNNNMVRLISRPVATAYTQEFEQMFAGRFGTDKQRIESPGKLHIGNAVAEIAFSPQGDVAEQVIRRIQTARSSIHFLAFSFTADSIANAMVERIHAGLVVRGVFEMRNAIGSSSKLALLKSSGGDVVTDGNCYIMHHKVIIIDKHIVITGSYNFTASAEQSNDENLVIIDDPNIARIYLQEFERVYTQAQTPTRCT